MDAEIKRIFPESQTLSEESIQGTLESIDLAKNTEEFVIASKTGDGTGHVYFFDKDGNLKWELNHDVDSEIEDFRGVYAKLSENGQGMLVNWFGGWEL